MKPSIVICATSLLDIFNLIQAVTLSPPSQAFTAKGLCTALGGSCRKDHTCCAGRYDESALCIGYSVMRCCIDRASDDLCKEQGGICRYACGRSLQIGLCSGQFASLCCVYRNPDAPCIDRGGKCQLFQIRCVEKPYPGLCASGPPAKGCCIPQVR